MRHWLIGFLGLWLTAPALAEVDYVRDVKPLLAERCFSCHGALRQKRDLRLDAAKLLLKGGKSGPIVIPGKPDESSLLDAVRGENGIAKMPPPDEGTALTDAQIDTLRRWILEGAKAPDEPIPAAPDAHWAFQPVVRSAVPARTWGTNPIDAFLAHSWAKQGLTPAAPTSKELLLRRVTIDLTGLPPTRAELHAFLADEAPDAYSRVVDRLLQSPAYGERWARHWMDVWRYSDWFGRRGVPDVWNSAPQVWRWRDWIIESLNRDHGYDRMVREMLAGDELAPHDEQAVNATGYLVRNWYALNPNQWMRDNVEHTGKAFLGLTFNCAHCHDHKYDPISQEEYFAFRAFFEPINVRQDRVAGEPDPGPYQQYQYSVLRKVQPLGAVRVFDERPDAKTLMYRGGDERVKFEGRPPIAPAGPKFLGAEKLDFREVILPPEVAYPGLKPFVREEERATRIHAIANAKQRLAMAVSPLHEIQVQVAEADLAALNARIEADDAKWIRRSLDAPALAAAASKAEKFLAWLKAKEQRITAQTNLDAAPADKKDAASKAVAAADQAIANAEKALSVASATYTPLSPTYPQSSTGRRTALAMWMTDRRNPLTARVAVNQMWMRHFGKPIVESVNDFGRNGKAPTHPELLDWLADELMQNRWSMKHLHRLIVMSAAYQMRSLGADASASNLARDPDNRWLWHFPAKRVEAEVVRDSMLYVAGQLDGTIGGRPLPHTNEATTFRRSMYYEVYAEGGGQMQMLTLFDAPDPADCYRRAQSIIPQQAFVMTNSKIALDQSRWLAQKLASEPDFVNAAYETILSRRPTDSERSMCAAFLDQQVALYRQQKVVPTKGEAAVLPAADPVQRARESLIRVLFSHDQFVTIR